MGTVSPAVASHNVGTWATTTMTANPIAGSRAPGSGIATSRSSANPQPTQSARRTSGNSTQAIVSSILPPGPPRVAGPR